MDVATLLATVTDPSLRREIFMNMNEGAIAALPPALMAEARRVHDHIHNDRARMRQAARAMLDPPHAHADLFGMGGYRGRHRMRDEME
jgi:hypothetical protein